MNFSFERDFTTINQLTNYIVQEIPEDYPVIANGALLNREE